MTRTGRSSALTVLAARLTLAAFAATSSGASVWAQAAARAAHSMPPAGVTAVGPAYSAPALLGASALSPAALIATLPAVLPVAASEDHTAASDGGGASALDTLAAAAADAGGGFAGRGASQPFDGSQFRGKGASDLPAPAEAPVMTLQEPIYPGARVQLRVDSAEAIAVVNAALSRGGYMIAATAGQGTDEGHNLLATLVRVSQPTRNGGQVLLVVMDAVRSVKIAGYGKTGAGVMTAKTDYPPVAPSDPTRLKDLAFTAQHLLDQFAPLDPSISKGLVTQALAQGDPERLTSLLAQSIPFSEEVKQELLAAPSSEARLQRLVLELMGRFKENAPKAVADGGQDGFDTVEGLKAKMRAIGMPAAVQEAALKEFENFKRMDPQSPEAQKLRSYIEWLVDVPWGRRTEDNLDIAAARRALDKDHMGLERVKERVLEFLALRKKTGSKKGAILAFTGPPGVGKTSIAAAIAEAMGRRFVRLSLGGVHDETALRGHGRTYLGSMPGEIIRQMKAAGTVNPVMLLDEVDKVGRGSDKGDPTAALLEILDPAQNNTFRDRYLDVPYDLSEVLFVVTANELGSIPEPLRDRMEIIEFEGYTTLEKIAIAERHIIPQKRAAAGLSAEDAVLTKDAVRRVIEGYTMEAGVRALREKIETVMRKISAWSETRGEAAPGVVDESVVAKYLGVPRFSPRETAQNGVGVATGLAVNTYGGSTLNVEVSREPGSGQLRLRKQFGDDIEDSAKNAYKYVKKNAAALGISGVDFTKIDVDINITPAGKVDGPSAGGLMTTAIISALTGRPVKAGVAMTGEITMRGDILPIGGLKQKVMAAHRMGYKEVIFPFANLKDIEDIPKEVRDGIVLTPVKTYDEVLRAALEPAL